MEQVHVEPEELRAQRCIFVRNDCGMGAIEGVGGALNLHGLSASVEVGFLVCAFFPVVLFSLSPSCFVVFLIV